MKKLFRTFKRSKSWEMDQQKMFNKLLTNQEREKVLNLLELSVIVFGLFGSTSPSWSIQMWCEWISGRTCSGRLSSDGTTITTSPLLPLQSFSRWLAYCVGIELLNERKSRFKILSKAWRTRECLPHRNTFLHAITQIRKSTMHWRTLLIKILLLTIFEAFGDWRVGLAWLFIY